MVNIRMNRRAFKRLCEFLESKGGLCNSKHMLVDEQVAMFLDTLTHNQKNKIIVNRFQRSGETISRNFKIVLDAVCRLHKDFYKIPVRVPDNEMDERWKWFKGCLGALDETYIKVRVPTDDRKPYRTRKGTYYLCDAGYTNGEGFLTPFRGQRHHLNDWSNPPTTAKELYNKKHSSTRNVIERCFGLIKARWAILRDNSYHPVESMPRVIIACCLMHNFIRTEMTQDPLDNEVAVDHTHVLFVYF
ncbi:ALP1-like protein [Tanacetum coccineum]